MIKTWCILLGITLCGLSTVVRGQQLQQSPANCPRTNQAATSPAKGPAALEDALKKYDAVQAKIKELEPQKGTLGAIDRQLDALYEYADQSRAEIDALGGQRGCTVSRLFWYTNLDEAKAASARSGKPILSLRMLGKLTDEFSCANSRFFRTALYSNTKVSDFMRDNFVLHWQSVRPVPRVTIDFGDGRKLERTLTGNSAHYVLASDGTPLDVLPGLYGPQPFLNWLAETNTLFALYERVGDRAAGSNAIAAQAEVLKSFHSNQTTLLLNAWDRDLQRLGEAQTRLVAARIDTAMQAAELANKRTSPNAAPQEARPAPMAVVAARVAVGKSAAEVPMLRFANLGGTWMERGMDEELWQAVANLHRTDVKLDNASVAVVRKEFPAAVAMRVAVSKRKQEDPVLRMVRTFEDSMSLDTVRNEYLLHRKIHEQFTANDPMIGNIDELNSWVYADLFLTPSSDPWLGLAPNDVYTALENDGRTETRAK